MPLELKNGDKECSTGSSCFCHVRLTSVTERRARECISHAINRVGGHFLFLLGRSNTCLLPPAFTVWNFIASVLSCDQGDSNYEGKKGRHEFAGPEWIQNIFGLLYELYKGSNTTASRRMSGVTSEVRTKPSRPDERVFGKFRILPTWNANISPNNATSRVKPGYFAIRNTHLNMG